MGEDFKRKATPGELERMRSLVRADMEAGALGLATGLEYDPGIYSDPQEVVELAKVASAFGGRYISHIRSEDRDFWDALDELIVIGRTHRMPVQVSHLKLAMRDLWGRAEAVACSTSESIGLELTAYIYPTLLAIDADALPNAIRNRATAEFCCANLGTEGLLLRSTPRTTYLWRTSHRSVRSRYRSPATLMALIREPRRWKRRPSAAPRACRHSMGLARIERCSLVRSRSVQLWWSRLPPSARLFACTPAREYTQPPFPLGLGAILKRRFVRRMRHCSPGASTGYFADLVLSPGGRALPATRKRHKAVIAFAAWGNGARFRSDAAGRHPGRVLRRAAR